MNRRKWIYIGILIVVAAIVSIASFSYAFLTRVDEQHGKINIVAGTLDYKIESDDLENNSITLSANESKEIEITIKSVNKINSKYQLYTNNVENVDIRYTDEEEPGVGTISSNGTKTIKVVLENNSDTDKTITFGVQGGFEDKTLTLEDNRVAVVLGDGLCQVGEVYNFDYTGDVQEFTAKCSGTYKIEAWGAEGANSYDGPGGKGGYVSGNIELSKADNLYVYVGNKGTADTNGWNGGGVCHITSGTHCGSTGGGATDIRVVSGNWNDSTSLGSRIMVAGAGGGAGGFDIDDRYNVYYSTPGAGGGLKGYNTSNEQGGWQPSKGGTQILGGYNTYNSSAYVEDTYGSFGMAPQSDNNSCCGAGGGSGWYGGGGGCGSSGGGGSSYISGHTGCVAVTSKTSNSPKSGCTDGNSNKACSVSPYEYEFKNTVVIDGAGCNWTNTLTTTCNGQPQPDGTNATGHFGNGYAKITYLGTRTVTFNVNGGEVSENSRKVNYGYAVGELPTPTKSQYAFKGWYLDSTLTTLIDENYIVTDDITLYAKYAPLKTYLYNSGTISNLVGSFTRKDGHGSSYIGNTSIASVSYASTYIRLTSGTGSVNNYGVGIISTKTINLVDYDKLCVRARHDGTNCTYNYGVLQYGISTSNAGSGNYIDDYTGILAIDSSSSTTASTKCVDISSYNGSYYLILHNAYSGYSDFSSVWLSNEE